MPYFAFADKQVPRSHHQISLIELKTGALQKHCKIALCLDEAVQILGDRYVLGILVLGDNQRSAWMVDLALKDSAPADQ